MIVVTLHLPQGGRAIMSAGTLGAPPCSVGLLAPRGVASRPGHLRGVRALRSRLAPMPVVALGFTERRDTQESVTIWG